MTKLILAGLMIMAFPACVDLGKAEPAAAAPSAAEPAPPMGRYQLIQLGVARADQFLLDTQTGVIWRSVCLYGDAAHGNCGSDYWERQKVEGITVTRDDVAQIMQAHDKSQRHRQPASR